MEYCILQYVCAMKRDPSLVTSRHATIVSSPGPTRSILASRVPRPTQNQLGKVLALRQRIEIHSARGKYVFFTNEVPEGKRRKRRLTQSACPCIVPFQRPTRARHGQCRISEQTPDLPSKFESKRASIINHDRARSPDRVAMSWLAKRRSSVGLTCPDHLGRDGSIHRPVLQGVPEKHRRQGNGSADSRNNTPSSREWLSAVVC
ncbi:hypothetical protein C8Q80DRAFT_1191119 [Daedaleopsis nitida]|nr:hypothetical protein C8Q80DRAFT_1191119 [Daedaleopsis nitida]